MFTPSLTKTSGYQLLDKGSGLWQIKSPVGIFTGNLKQVCTYAVLRLGFELNELEIGVLEMEKHWHNAAEYGIFKRFMWSYDSEEKQPKTGSN